MILGCKRDKPYVGFESDDASVSVLGTLVSENPNIEVARLNLITLAYYRALTELIKDQKYTPIVLSHLRKTPKYQKLTFQFLIENIHGFGLDLNSQLMKQLTMDDFSSLLFLDLDTTKLHESLTSFLNYNGYKYQPEVHRASNFMQQSRVEDIIIAVAHDVTDDDEIPAWRLSDEDIFLLGEKEATESEVPVLIVGLGDFATELESEDEEVVATSATCFNCTAGIFCKSMRVYVNYDNTNKQEVSVIGVRYKPNVIVSNTVKVPLSRKKIFNLQDNHIGLWVNFTTHKFFTDVIEDNYFDGTQIFYATFEYDWYASNKVIENPCWSNSQMDITNAKMKFSSEFYTKTCGEIDALFPDYFWGSPTFTGVEKTTTFSSKGTFTFILKNLNL
jgi:hypothetical protein